MSYNQLLDEHSLSDTGTSEETNLSTTSVGSEKVDDLDTGDEDLSGGGLLDELRGIGVDGQELVGLNGTTLVNGVTSDVHDATKSSGADGDGDGRTGVGGLAATDETLSTVHSNATDDVLSQMLRNLEDELLAVVLGGQGVENGRKLLGVELDVNDGAYYKSVIGLSMAEREACR